MTGRVSTTGRLGRNWGGMVLAAVEIHGGITALRSGSNQWRLKFRDLRLDLSAGSLWDSNGSRGQRSRNCMRGAVRGGGRGRRRGRRQGDMADMACLAVR